MAFIVFHQPTFIYEYFITFLTKEHMSLNRILLANPGMDPQQESHQKYPHNTILAPMNNVISYDAFLCVSSSGIYI